MVQHGGSPSSEATPLVGNGNPLNSPGKHGPHDGGTFAKHPVSRRCCEGEEDSDCERHLVDWNAENATANTVAEIPVAGLRWFNNLRYEYGWRLMIVLFASQHILKGFTLNLSHPATQYLYGQYALTGPRRQIFDGITQMPWSLKPVVGVCSDLFPIAGRHKGPYILLASVVGILSFYNLGFTKPGDLSISHVVMLLFGVQLQASVCDLMVEAKYSEKINEKPAHGPDLVTFVWVGINVCSIGAQCLIGKTLAAGGPRLVFALCVVPASIILWPTLRNDMGERQKTAEQIAETRKKLMKEWEVFVLAILLFVCVCVLSMVGVHFTDVRVHLCTALVCIVVLIGSFALVLRPDIARLNTFFVLQASLSVGIRGATFYFYTDDEVAFPDGPHFSVEFFTAVLGVVSSVFSIIGLVAYNTWFKHWSYRHLLYLGNSLYFVVCLLDVPFFLRLNLRLGIPDYIFVFGSTSFQQIVYQWQWMPGMVVLSQMCPKGMEATMFALLAGCHNFGVSIAQFLGGFLLDSLGVDPAGLPDEGAKFDNLWIASLVASVLPFLAILLVPLMIPDARQTDTLLIENAHSATAGSLLSRWLGTPPPTHALLPEQAEQGDVEPPLVQQQPPPAAPHHREPVAAG